MKNFLEKLNWFMDKAASLIMINMVVVITLQILMRYIFDNPLQWSEELARFSYGWYCLFGMALVTKDKTHLTVSILIDRLSPRIQYFFNLLALALMLVFFVVVSWSTLGLPKVQGNIRAYSLGIPFYVLHMSIIPGFVVSAIYTVYHLYLEIWPERKRI
jgi:TRAP-type C4-dicarboxylate transport system permease small subunit